MDEKLDNISKSLELIIFWTSVFLKFPGTSTAYRSSTCCYSSPFFLLADEPTGNLDSKAAIDVMELFTKLNKEEDATILMVTHDPFAASYCNRVIFIKDGELYNELHRGLYREKFYQEILDVLALLGGRRG